MTPIQLSMYFVFIFVPIALTVAGIYSMYQHIKIVDSILLDMENNNES